VPVAAAQPSTTSLAPIARRDFGEAEARHLLWRAGFGASHTAVRAAAEAGPEASVDALLDAPAESTPLDQFPSQVRDFTEAERRQIRRARRAQDQDTLAKFRRRRQAQQRADRRQMREIGQWWLRRLIDTQAPLVERMTLLWHDHFATSYRGVRNSRHMLLQNDLFRKHALGDFHALLHGVVRDPAMLVWLDNHRSHKRRPNENLARELLELFTLGIGAYSERDIKEGARALTGYTYDGDEFRFRRRWHDENTKEILGRRGEFDGDDFVEVILERQECARFIAARLYDGFVAPLPRDLRRAPRAARDVVERLAATLWRADYRIESVLRQLLLSKHFYDAAHLGARIKSPVELIVGAVRTLEIDVRSVTPLLRALDAMGQTLFLPPTVAGWDGGRAWINTSTLYLRQNTLALLLTGGGERRDIARFDPEALAARASDPGNLEAVAATILATLLGPHGDPASPGGAARLRTLLGFARDIGGRSNEHTVLGMALLATAMPEHQLC